MILIGQGEGGTHSSALHNFTNPFPISERRKKCSLVEIQIRTTVARERLLP